MRRSVHISPLIWGGWGESPPIISSRKSAPPPILGEIFPKFRRNSSFFVSNLSKSVQKRQIFGGACGGLKNRRFSSVLKSKSGFFAPPPGKNPPHPETKMRTLRRAIRQTKNYCQTPSELREPSPGSQGDLGFSGIS